jgi:tripartite-type tricarboxylate transporter receptor subunit TctC
MRGAPVAAFAALCATAASAQAPADFYRGKTIEISVGTGPGGGYDLNARLLARHFGRFVAGNPNVVVANIPGGGGIVAANRLYNVAPADGLFLGTFSNAMLTEPLFGAGTAKFDTRRFGWLGSMSREDVVCVASRASGVAGWGAMRGKQLVVGSTAPGTTTYLYPMLLSRLLGADLKFVSGYTDGSQVALALERGEVELICQNYSSMRVAHADWIASGFVKPIVYIGLAPNPELPGVPTIGELAEDPQAREIIKITLAPGAAGRPYAAPPATPADRVAALRKAFDDMMADAAFLDDSRKSRLDATPMRGAEIDALLREIYAASPAALNRVRALVAAVESR